MLRLTKTEAPEIGANIRKHQHDNATFAMFLADIEDDVDLKSMSDAELGQEFFKWCESW